MGSSIYAVLSNPRHPEYGHTRVSFPIPTAEYDKVIEQLQSAKIIEQNGDECKADDLYGSYQVLDQVDSIVKLDELDYLAKRLESFSEDEDAQFQAMAHKLHLTSIKDLINLSFCQMNVTVITDFSNLEIVGRKHYIRIMGGAASTDELDELDGYETACLLIDNGQGVVTPYGVVYDNGMELLEEYNGRQFPLYVYDRTMAILEVTPKQGLAEGQNPEYLYLPASRQQIARTLRRVDISSFEDANIRMEETELPESVAAAIDWNNLTGKDILDLNRLCADIMPMDEKMRQKMNAVLLMTQTIGNIPLCALAENLDLFEFIPDIHTPEDYGKYMIKESDHYLYDENLDKFYDFKRYGEQRIESEWGQFNKYGYVAYVGEMQITDLAYCNPAEPDDSWQSPQMTGI